jgi:hypothetical protein
MGGLSREDIGLLGPNLRRGRDRHGQVRRGANDHAFELRRRDSNDRDAQSGDAETLPNHIRVCRESACPKAMAEHSDRSLSQIVFWSNRAAKHGIDSQGPKVVATDKHQLSQLQGSVHLRRQTNLIESDGLGKDLLLL